MSTTSIYFIFEAMDEEFELSADLEAQPVSSDYGVPGSPTWTEYDNITISWPIEINGRNYTEAALIAEFGKSGADGIEAQILSAAEDADWDDPEPDYYERDDNE